MAEKNLQELIEGCVKQNRQCQKELYKLYYSYAMAICLRYANDRDEAAGIMNQGFFKVFKYLKNYDENRPFKIWLGKIMTNVAIDHYRAAARMAVVEELDKAEHVSDVDMADKRLHYNDLLGMIQRLPRAYRLVFNLFAIEGYSHEEIADMLAISTGASKSNLHKARQKLKLMILAADKSDKGNYGADVQYAPIVAMNGLYLNTNYVLNNFFR
ncbi:RNA polymerase sigma factor [Mucilaginibacter sp. UR6-1]|uniref:RNA polymerase sigma factor n=1 Tax=Mucilaginibacter sp. UR6-1 TaxID=1435643 RepID=UPI001E53EE3E|nr:RNA polymerase sigma factor [Mucilaginibacter sp. UR6-1]MCC8407390.1 RNA polymerase sigma factor [Mucilaginibacter sp. UR6-1]